MSGEAEGKCVEVIINDGDEVGKSFYRACRRLLAGFSMALGGCYMVSGELQAHYCSLQWHCIVQVFLECVSGGCRSVGCIEYSTQLYIFGIAQHMCLVRVRASGG